MSADAIPPEATQSFTPREWTKPCELTEEEKAKLVLEVIQNAIIAGRSTSVTLDKSEADVASVIASTPPKPTLVAEPSNKESFASVIPQNTQADAIRVQQTTATALKEAEPSPTTTAYQKKYQELQAQWKIQTNGKSMSGGYSLFFQQDDFLNAEANKGTDIQKTSDYPYGASQKIFNDGADGSPEALSSGNLTTNALQALMLRFLSYNPLLDIPVDSIAVAQAFVDSAPGNAIRLDESLIKSVILTPALDAFNKKGKNIYASLMRIDAEGKGQYVVVVDEHGHVCIIDPTVKEKSYKDKLLSEVVKSLNKARTAQDVAFIPIKTEAHANEENIVNTGITGPDTDNSNNAIYAFTYWAAFMGTDKLEAYESVNGAATEETSALDVYESINLSGVYSRKIKKTPGLKGVSGFEANIREWLQSQLRLN